jgi:hypothetical protein
MLYTDASWITSCALLTSSSANVLIERLGGGGVSIVLAFF